VGYAKIILVAVAAAAGVGSPALLAHGAATPASQIGVKPSFVVDGRVVRVVDGDTLIASVGRTSKRVRLIGIDAPEIGRCYSASATTYARKVALNGRVRLLGDASQAKRDRYGRLLAYVRLANGHDLGRDLIAGGFANVYVYERAFARLSAYRAAESTARARHRGLWSACSSPPGTTSPRTTTATTTSITTTIAGTTTNRTNCHASYPGVCIPPPPPDLDCRDVHYTDFKVLWTVPDPDPHRLDGDHDGIGCET